MKTFLLISLFPAFLLASNHEEAIEVLICSPQQAVLGFDTVIVLEIGAKKMLAEFRIGTARYYQEIIKSEYLNGSIYLGSSNEKDIELIRSHENKWIIRFGDQSNSELFPCN